MQTVTTKERLHKLVDELSDEETARTLEFAERAHEDEMIAAFRDPPANDEPWTGEHERAAREADADFAAGFTVSHEEMLHDR
jgi:hypothetical protein